LSPEFQNFGDASTSDTDLGQGVSCIWKQWKERSWTRSL